MGTDLAGNRYFEKIDTRGIKDFPVGDVLCLVWRSQPFTIMYGKGLTMPG